nr:MAG TPA: hypothetical protein [Caudoviricetes sp.]
MAYILDFIPTINFLFRNRDTISKRNPIFGKFLPFISL